MAPPAVIARSPQTMTQENPEQTIRLTEYSHGAGCGCKISPQLLDTILASSLSIEPDPRLLIGNNSKDDAAAYDIGNGTAILSTTDFFMPIADDPGDFGRIAATNAISDIYAMGGTPLMAIAILGWPVARLSATVAAQVVDGARQTCRSAGIALAGGHSIDAPEPIFGLAVTGQVQKAQLKANNTAAPGCLLYLTKPLGIGILSTAQKKKQLAPEHARLAVDLMCQLNNVGPDLALVDGVRALTDVTGFGLAGHLLEMCTGSQVSAVLDYRSIPTITGIDRYLDSGCIPGGTLRNFDSYGDSVAPLTETQRNLLCDPQTSGGLLIAVEPSSSQEVESILTAAGLPHGPIGELTPQRGGSRIEIRNK